MTNVWFTADQHHAHANIIRYANRPFQSVAEMDDALIANWNGLVADNDDVYVLGDFTLADTARARLYISRLKGFIHVIPGSHDHWIPKAWDKQEWFYSASGHGIVILPMLFEYSLPANLVGPRPSLIALSHYSMRSWGLSHYGSLHLYGHHHGRLPGHGRSMDIGVDVHDFKPVLLDDVIQRLKQIEILPKNGARHATHNQ